MEKIKNIVFDFGGVLIDWNPRYLYRDYFRNDVEMEYFLSHICTGEWNAEQDRGRPFDAAVQMLTEQYPQYEEPIRMFRDGWEYMLKGEFPKSVELLKHLKVAGYRIYGLTNWSAETFPIAYSKYDFLHSFDGIVVSGEEKLIKPDPRIYRVLLERYALIPEETLFLDDNLVNVETARQLGIRAILFDNIENVMRQLGENGISLKLLNKLGEI